MFFFFNDTATTEIYTLSLHDALPISGDLVDAGLWVAITFSTLILAFALVMFLPRAADRFTTSSSDNTAAAIGWGIALLDRKSTRLNSSHANISYAVFCLKKNNITRTC